MQLYLNTFYPLSNKKIKLLTLFGYSSQGIPGIEIVGLGRQGRLIKEKLVYFLRQLRVQLPLRRFVICIDEKNNLFAGEFAYLELPCLLMLLALSKKINILNLHQCIASGRLNLDGSVSLGWSDKLLLSDKYIALLDKPSLQNREWVPRRFILLEDVLLKEGFVLPNPPNI